MTNAEKIRNMSDNELAAFLDEIGSCIVCAWYRVDCKKPPECIGGIIEWLKQEVDQNDER